MRPRQAATPWPARAAMADGWLTPQRSRAPLAGFRWRCQGLSRLYGGGGRLAHGEVDASSSGYTFSTRRQPLLSRQAAGAIGGEGGGCRRLRAPLAAGWLAAGAFEATLDRCRGVVVGLGRYLPAPG